MLKEDENDINFDSLKENLDAEGEKISASLGKDEFAELTGTKKESAEYREQHKLAETVSDINSTRRVNLTLKLMELGGWLGLAIGFVTKLISLIYDFGFHIKDITDRLGEFWTGILAASLVILMIGLLHFSAKGLLNSKWVGATKFFWAFIFVLTMLVSFYIDYRAIDNYSTATTSAIKNVKLLNVNNALGSQNAVIDSKRQIIMDNIMSASDSIKAIDGSIKSNQEQIQKVNDSINKVKDKKLTVKSQKRIRQLNQNVYTSRKQLKQLEANGAKLQAQREQSKLELEEEQKKLTTLEGDKQKIIGSADKEMEDEKAKRVGFFFALVFLIEFISNFGLIAEAMASANVKKKEVVKLIQEEQTHKDILSAVKTSINNRMADDLTQFGKESDMLRFLQQVQNYQKLNQMNGSIQATKENVKLLGNFSDMVGKVNDDAMKSVTYQVEAIKAKRENEGLKLLLEELKKE